MNKLRIFYNSRCTVKYLIKIIKSVLSLILVLLAMVGFAILFLSTINGNLIDSMLSRIGLFCCVVLLILGSKKINHKPDDYKYFDEPWKKLLLAGFFLFPIVFFWVMYKNIEFVAYIFGLEILKISQIYVEETNPKP